MESQSERDIRQRKGQRGHLERRTLNEVVDSFFKDQDASEKGQISCITWMLMLFVFYTLLALLNLAANSRFPSVKSIADSKPDEFTEERARFHLENIVKVGSRVSGSFENDVYTVKYILKTVAEIQDTAHASRKIEVDVQRPTGSFFLTFIDDFTSYYANISNTVVKVTTPESDGDALLLNCHTDSAINAPGASDDAVACSIMLEILRAVAVDEVPLLHPLVFLFNGAEENLLQASHGFITQHKWAKEIKTFINLEAAGAGGKEFVFQTGPENPWLVWAWAKHAPHPHGSSVGQDLFQSGIIPSDTDFRIYRDFGKIPGIDLAYIKNGYVYHTYHDTPEMIPSGCIQRAGENILGMVRHLVQSPESLLSNPSAYRHGEAAFFDFLGVYFVVIPLRILLFLNYLTIFAVLAHIGKRMLHPQVTGFNSFEYNSKLLKAIAVNILGYASCFLSSALLAAFLTVMGRSMCWYSEPLLISGLYLPAGLVGIVTVHLVAKKTIFKDDDPIKVESVFFDAVLVMWTSLVFQSRNIGSSYMFVFPTIFAVVGRGFVSRNMFSLYSRAPAEKRLLFYLASILIPTILWVKKFLLMLSFFVPIAGRSGSELPPEILIFGLVGAILVGLFSFQVTTVYIVKSLKWFYVAMVVCLLCSLAVAFSNAGFPYRNDPASPTNKRFFMQHVSREFHGVDGKPNTKDSGMFVSYLDYIAKDLHLGPEDLMKNNLVPCEGVKIYVEFACQFMKSEHIFLGSYCEMPLLMPVQQLVQKIQFIPMPAPPASVTTDRYPFTVKWDVTDVMVEGGDAKTRHVKVHVSVEGPPNMALHITPITTDLSSSTLERWSFAGDTKAARGKHHQSKETYFVYYGGGVVHPIWKFWLQLAVTSKIGKLGGEDPFLQLAFSAHYKPSGPVSRVNRQTPDLERITAQLHDWLAPMTWISLYKNYVI